MKFDFARRGPRLLWLKSPVSLSNICWRCRWGRGRSCLGNLRARGTSIAGLNGKHLADRTANCRGHEQRNVTLGVRRIRVTKPRLGMISDSEIVVDSYRHFASRDPSMVTLLEQSSLVSRQGRACSEDVAIEGTSIDRSSA